MVGEPDEEGGNSFGPFLRYHRALGIVQVGDEDQGSTILPDKFWTLRAYPTNPSPQFVFAAEVLEHLPLGEARLQVAAVNGCGYPMVEVLLENGKVKLITWLENPGSYHPERLRAWPTPRNRQ